MSRVELSSAPNGVVVTNSNNFVPGASVMIYTTGTLTPITIYADATTGATLTQPLITDSVGRIPGYADGQQTVDIVATMGTVAFPAAQTELTRGDAIPSLTGGKIPLSALPGHASTHATAGTDAIAPAGIGAEAVAHKDQPSGYPGLDGSSLIATAELGTGVASSSTYLRGDRTWAAGSATVSSVFGRTGVVVAANADYLAVATGGLTGAVAAARLVGGTTSGAPVAGTFAKGDLVIDQTGLAWICTTAGTPGTWANAGSSAGVSTFNSRSGAVMPGNADYLAVSSGGLTGATAAGRLVGATTGGAPVSGTFAKGDAVIDQLGAWWICTVAGTPGTWVKSPGAKIFRSTHTWTVNGAISVASGSADLVNYIPPMFVSVGSSDSVKVVKARYVLGTGTSATCKIQKGGVDLTGFTGISATTTAASTAPAGQAVVEDDVLALVVTAVSGSPGNLSFTLVLEHTVT